VARCVLRVPVMLEKCCNSALLSVTRLSRLVRKRLVCTTQMTLLGLYFSSFSDHWVTNNEVQQSGFDYELVNNLLHSNKSLGVVVPSSNGFVPAG